MVGEKIKNYIPIIDFIEKKKKVRFELEELNEEFESRCKNCVIYSYNKSSELQTKIQSGEFTNENSISNYEKDVIEVVDKSNEISNTNFIDIEKNIDILNKNYFDTVNGIEPEAIENQDEKLINSQVTWENELNKECNFDAKKRNDIDDNQGHKDEKNSTKINNIITESNKITNTATTYLNNNSAIGNNLDNTRKSDKILLENFSFISELEDYKIKKNSTKLAEENNLTNEIKSLMQNNNIFDNTNNEPLFVNNTYEERQHLNKVSKDAEINNNNNKFKNKSYNPFSKINIIDIDLSALRDNNKSIEKTTLRSDLRTQTPNRKKDSSDLLNNNTNKKLHTMIKKVNEVQILTASPKKSFKKIDERNTTPNKIPRNKSKLEISASNASPNNSFVYKKNEATNFLAANYMAKLQDRVNKNRGSIISNNLLGKSRDNLVDDLNINRSSKIEVNKSYLAKNPSCLFSNYKNNKSSLIRNTSNNKSYIEKSNEKSDKLSSLKKIKLDYSYNIYKNIKKNVKKEKVSSENVVANKESNQYAALGYTNNHNKASINQTYKILTDKISKNLLNKRNEKNESLIIQKKISMFSVKNFSNLIKVSNNNQQQNNNNNYTNELDRKYMEFPSKIKKKTNINTSIDNKNQDKNTLDDNKTLSAKSYYNLIVQAKGKSKNNFSNETSYANDNSVIKSSNNCLNVSQNKLVKDSSKMGKKISTKNFNLINNKEESK